MKKKDLILIGSILILALVGFVAVMMMKKDGTKVVIMVDGAVYEEVSLSEDKMIEIKTEHGVNVVQIKDGIVKMEEADCPDQICVKHASIKKTGETIVCIPHKVVVEVKADTQEKEIDSVAK